MSTGIRDFIKEIKNIDGCKTSIEINHKLYGNQRIEYNIQVLDDESRLGFHINDQDIYINKLEICDFGIVEGTYYFASKLMRIKLKTI
jgi:hypothetical protein